jgi:hypothetical protein
MRSFIRLSGSMAVVALAGTALTAAAPAIPALAAGPPPIRVPCRADALATAITAANSAGSAVLSLPANCTYNVATPATAADGLPLITGSVTLAGGRGTEIRRTGAAAFRLLDVAAGGTLILSSVSVTRGSTAGLGGGILNGGTLIINQGTLSGNKAGNGGAVSNSAGGTVRISDALISGNTTTGVGGGGIINFGTLSLAGSILSGNTAPINGGGLNTQPAGVSRLSQDTIIKNTAGGLGGGLANLGTLALTGTTVRLNKASGGGGIATGTADSVTLRASTVTDNAPDNCNPAGTIPGCDN